MRNVRLSALEKTARLQRFFADFSFSLYLVHLPLMLFVLGISLQDRILCLRGSGVFAASTQGPGAYASPLLW